MNINKVGVVGAGMMGAEIALCFAKAGFLVVLNDLTVELAQNGKVRQEAVLDKSIQKGKFDQTRKQAVLDRVEVTGAIEDLKDCDLIVEAAAEKLEIKHDIYRNVDKICKASCIIASNTSSISITKLAAAVSQDRAGQFIGTHFNSPASIMKLVEIIPGMLTSQETVEQIEAVLRIIEKEPVTVKDVTGFALNRLFHVFSAEACRLLEEGVATAEDIDKICVYGLGHPIGIFKLLDNMGHDLNIAVDQILFDAYGERFRPSPAMRRLVDAGRLGRKTGAGFHDYGKEGKHGK